MTLEKKKSVSLTGESKINGVVVVRMTATLSMDSGSDYVNQSIQDPALYAANRKDVRKDIQEFQNYIYDQQDQIASEAEANDTEQTDK